MDMAFHIAADLQWGDYDTTQGCVLYIAAEGANGFNKRLEGWRREHPEAGKDLPFYAIKDAPNLGTSSEDLEYIIWYCEENNIHPKIICIDTLVQSLGGGDENGGGMATIVSNATKLARHFDALVVFVHHVGLKDVERLRGHTSLKGGVDASLFALREGDGLVSSLKVLKQKDGEIGLNDKRTAHIGFDF
jgi:hypothetical protein